MKINKDKIVYVDLKDFVKELRYAKQEDGTYKDTKNNNVTITEQMLINAGFKIEVDGVYIKPHIKIVDVNGKEHFKVYELFADASSFYSANFGGSEYLEV